jgi:hypothetical protein
MANVSMTLAAGSHSPSILSGLLDLHLHPDAAHTAYLLYKEEVEKGGLRMRSIGFNFLK